MQRFFVIVYSLQELQTFKNGPVFGPSRKALPIELIVLAPFDFIRYVLYTTDELIELVNLRPSTTYVLNIGAKNQVGVGESIEYAVTTDNVSE